jgi:hypothetical protein
LPVLAVVACAGLLASCGDDAAAPIPPKYTITLTVPATANEGDGTVASTVDIAPAPDTGTTVDVALSSDAPGNADVPAAVTVTDTGTAGFNITLRADDDIYQDAVDVIITATGPDCTPDLGMISLADDQAGRIIVTIPLDTAAEGDADLATCTVDVYPALTGSDTVDVTIGSDKADVVVLDTTVTVDSSGPAIFRLSFRADNATYEADALATILGYGPNHADGTDTITVTDDELGQITVTVPATATEGAGTLAAAGTVTVTPAPTSGTVTVDLGSIFPTDAVPAVASVDVGVSGTANFDIDIRTDNATYEADVDALFRAQSTGYVEGQDTITVQDDELGTITITLSDATEGDTGVLGTVTIAPPPTAGTVTVDLVSGNASAAVPATVVVDTSGTNTFAVTIRADNATYQPDVVATIDGTSTGYVAGADTITVTDDEIGVITVVIAPTGATEGDAPVTAQIMIGAPGVTDGTIVTVTLDSDSTADATVPAFVDVTITSETGNANFDITIVDDAITDGDILVTVTGSSAGYEEVTDDIRVFDDD